MRKFITSILISLSILVVIIAFVFVVFKSGNQAGNQNKASAGPPITIGYKQVKTDPQIKAVIDSSQLIGGNLTVKFHHNSIKEEPVSISGHVNYQLSRTTAKPGEIITLTVFNWSTEYFEIKIGQQSDHFGFGNQADSLDNDKPVLKELTRQGINKADVVIEQDYAPKGNTSPYGAQSNPYGKTYRDRKSGKSIMVISDLPMVSGDGAPVDVGWNQQGNKFTEKSNLFKATVNGDNVTLIVKNNQADGRKKNDKLSFHAQLFLNGIEQTATGPVLLETDPVNSNYTNNTLEWDYGIAKRRLRLIEGHVLGSWVFSANPNGDVRIVYNQSGDYRLKLGRYKFNEDEERVSAAQFDAASYPFEVSDSATYYPDAHPETTSVDGSPLRYASGTWSQVRDGVGNGGNDSVASLYCMYISSAVTSNEWQEIDRAIILFDTSGLPDTASVSNAVLSLYGDYKNNTSSWTPDVNIYTATPVSNTAIAYTDYSQIGTTAQSTAITYSNWSISGYNDFILNDMSKISLTGISKFGTRNANYDAANSPPAWASSQSTAIYSYASEQGNGYKPQLVVTYSLGVTPTPTQTLAPAVNFNGGINLSGGICVGGSACSTVSPGFTCGNNVSFTYNGSGVTYGTVSHNGACWMDRNLGASEVATSYNDSNAYGDLFQWGRLADGHQLRTSGTTTNLSSTDVPGNSNFIYGMGYPYDWRSPQNNNLWQGASGVNGPCPSGWRIPTSAEWTTEYESWSSQDYNGAFASPLKLTAGGYRSYADASLNNLGTLGDYWSSTVNNDYGYTTYFLTFIFNQAHMSTLGRGYGMSVRCVQSNVYSPNPSWTKITGTTVRDISNLSSAATIAKDIYCDNNNCILWTSGASAPNAVDLVADSNVYGNILWSKTDYCTGAQPCFTSVTWATSNFSISGGDIGGIHPSGLQAGTTSTDIGNKNWLAKDYVSTPGTFPVQDVCKAMGPGWRLPNLLEFDSIRDQAKGSSPYTRLPNIIGAAYWSSTEYDSSDAEYLNFNNGAVGITGAGKTGYNYARCVYQPAVPWSCGNIVNFTYKGSPVTYGTVSHNGACWLDRNLGASEVATAYNDSNAYGDLFQWGRLDDGHQTRTSIATTGLSGSDNPGNSNFLVGMGDPYDWRSPQGSGCGGNSCLWQGVSGVNNPCPSGWRIPTATELDTERASWSSQDYYGAFASPLKLTAGGYRSYVGGGILSVGGGGGGVYWNSTVSGTYAGYLVFESSYASMVYYYRAYGYSVRCILN